MNRITGVIYMQLRDRTILYLPWLIVSISFLVNLVIGYMMSEEESFYTGGISSLFVYMFVIGIVMLAQTFPFALGFSVRRRDYFWGTAAAIASVSAAFAVILLVLGYVETFTNLWGVGLHFFKLPYLNDGPAVVQLWIFFAVLLNMFYLGFVISSVHRRFGKKGTWTLMIALFIAFTVTSYLCTFNGWWGSIFSWFASQTAFELSLWMFVGAVLYALVSYGVLRRATA